MKKILYHNHTTSFYVELYRVRYRGEDYNKYWVKYYSKSSGRYIGEERNVTIYHSAQKHWEALIF